MIELIHLVNLIHLIFIYHHSYIAVADLGEGTKLRRRAEKKFRDHPPPPPSLSPDLDDRPAPLLI